MNKMIESECFFTEFTFEGFKNLAPVICNSNRMLDHLRWLEWDPNVRSYFQSFMEINIEYSGFIYSAFIDFWMVDQEDKVNLVHLLDREAVQLFDEQPSLKLKVKEHCRKMQMKYLPISPPKRWAAIQTKNLNFLWNYSRIEITSAHRLLTKVFFIEQKLPTLGKLKVFLKKHGFDIELAYSLIFHKVVLADINFVFLSDRSALQSNVESLNNIEVKNPIAEDEEIVLIY